MFIGAENLRPYLMAAVANSLYNWALIFSVLKQMTGLDNWLPQALIQTLIWPVEMLLAEMCEITGSEKFHLNTFHNISIF